MSEETLLSAARRLVRFIRADLASGGGIISIETQIAIDTCERQIVKAQALKKVEEAK